jgi:hypothetical protein
MEPSPLDIERGLDQIRVGRSVPDRYDDMRPVLYENLFEAGIGGITSAIQPLLFIPILRGGDQFNLLAAEDTDYRQLIAPCLE